MAVRTRRRSHRRFSAKQLAAQRLFAKRARSGAFGRGRRRNEWTERRPARGHRRAYEKGIRSHMGLYPGSQAHSYRWPKIKGWTGAARTRRRFNPEGLALFNEPGRKRSRRRKHNMARKRSRRRSGYRSRRRNPLGGVVGRVLSPVKQVFTKETLMEGLQLGAGAVVTPIVTNKILDLVGKPEWKTGYTGYLAQLVGAGLVGAIAGFVLPPRVARNLMLGGVVGVTSVVLNREVLARVSPALATSGTSGLAGLGSIGQSAAPAIAGERMRGYLRQRGMSLAGMGEYATVREAEGIEGLSEYLTV